MSPKRILVACEFSGIVRNAFLDLGFDAVSCDILPTTSNRGQHYQGNVINIINDEWDLIIAHPPCTYLCNSGVRWLFEQPGRMAKMRDAANFFVSLLECKCNHVCIENPIPHGYAMVIIKEKYSQKIQPWQFGHGETKATCLWLKNLPPLEPTNIVEGREARIHKMSKSDDRGLLRSITYQGIANAMAEQWGSFINKEAV